MLSCRVSIKPILIASSVLLAGAGSAFADAMLAWPVGTSLVPTPVTGMTSGVTSISSGQGHDLNLKDGRFYIWGTNTNGQLGNGTTGGTSTPTLAAGFDDGVTQFSAGYRHSVFVRNATVYATGANIHGQIGNGASGGNVTTPTPVIGLSSGVTALSAGVTYNLAIKDGAVYGWGTGSPGNGTGGTTTTPIKIDALSTGVTAIAAGSVHNLVIKDGGAFAWGSNNYLQLGTNNPSTSVEQTPVPIPGLESGVTAVAAGSSHSLAIKDGNVYAWGKSHPMAGYTAPWLLLDEAVDFVDVAAGKDTSFALSSDGRIWAWGENRLGQLGLGDQVDRWWTPTPLPAPQGYRFTAIEAAVGTFRTTALIAPRTQYGDANLDGTVDFDDLLTLAQHYDTTAGATWSQGDFDLDGAVSFSDLLTLAQHYGPAAPEILPGGSEGVHRDWALARSLLPEPAALGIGTLLLTCRRRR